MCNTVTLGTYLNFTGTAIIIVIIVTSVHIAFNAVVVSMHFIACKVITGSTVAHDYTSLLFWHKPILISSVEMIPAVNPPLMI